MGWRSLTGWLAAIFTRRFLYFTCTYVVFLLEPAWVEANRESVRISL